MKFPGDNIVVEKKDLKTVFFCVIILLSLLLFAIAADETITILLFVFYILVYIQIPGLLMIWALKNHKCFCVELLLHAFFFGLGILVIEYYIFSFLGSPLFLLLLNPTLSVLLLVRRWRSGDEKRILEAIPEIDIKLIVLVIITCLFTFAAQGYSFVDIEDCAELYLFQDIPWHIGNISSLSRGLPFFDIRFAGLKFNYHYFNDLVFGICKYCFGMDASSLLLKCTPLLTAYVFSLGAYSFFKRMSPHVLIGYAVFLCSGAAIPYYIMNTDDRYSLLNYHIFSNINGVAVSLASAISVYLYYVHIYEKENIEKRDLLILSILVFAMTGLKGPFAAVLLAAMMITSVLMALQDHNIGRMIGVAAASGISFLATYILIIKGLENLSRESNNNRTTAISITDTFARSRLWDTFSVSAESDSKLQILLYCLIVAVIGSIVAAGINYLFFAGKTLATLYTLVRKKEYPSAETIAALAVGWIGLAGFWLVSHTGFSQLYFLFIAVLFIVGESLRTVDSIGIRQLKIAMGAILLVNTVICGKMYITSVWNSIGNDDLHYSFRKESEVSGDVASLTHQELEGLEWIRDNTDTDCVVATDRLDLWHTGFPESEDDCRCFYYSAFAERQMYLEGYSYSDVSADEIRSRLEREKNIYSNDPEISDKAIRESEIDYIIVSDRFNSAPDSFGTPVYSNEDISIYKNN